MYFPKELINDINHTIFLLMQTLNLFNTFNTFNTIDKFQNIQQINFNKLQNVQQINFKICYGLCGTFCCFR